MKLHWLTLISTLLVVAQCADQSIEERENEAAQYIQQINEELIDMRNMETEASFDFQTNLTDENEQRSKDASSKAAKFAKEKVLELKKFDYKSFKDDNLKRQFKKLTELGYAALSDEDFKEMATVVAKMESNYAKVKVCDFKDRTKCNLSLNPEIEGIFSTSRDPAELQYYWEEWYKAAGTPVKKYFEKYVQLNEKAAKINGFSSGAEAWLHEYEDDTFEQQLEGIFDEIRPLYEHLHAYVRYRLNKYYGPDVVSEKGPMPMHLLGNMWAQTWESIAGIVQPFPDKPLFDVTDAMVKQGYTPKRMFEMADEFFHSINMTKVPQSFWEKSYIEKPTDGRDFQCHASAWDFYKNDDVRIKMCTRVTMDDFFTVHHEMGHIQYFLQYKNQPISYREGANPGFHEAVGDVLSLSVSTPKHLNAVGLLEEYELDEETKINMLFLKALEKIVFLPFAFTLDKYRWAIFRGEIKPENYNCEFWKLREQYSGIEPPVQRSENDFDAAAKYHISANVEYLRYLVSFIIQFQFYKSACEKAEQYSHGNPELPLVNCDFYGSANAGNAFKAMLAMGSSQPWPDAFEVLTGRRKMDATALLEYFEPLTEWLKKENEKLNVQVGWEPSTKCVATLSVS